MSDAPITEPDWIDRNRYSFEDRYMDFDPGQLHYVDEGGGRPVIFLHGNPTWSFLYRHLIDGLSTQYRCIALDHFGFGLSDKPVDWSYRPVDHARILNRFVANLDLSDVTLVVHDWGGPIGMDYATRNAENIHSIVAMNTVMWPSATVKVQLFSALFGSRIARILIRRYNLIAKWLMKLYVADPSTLPPDIHRHYVAPLATPDDREPAWVLAREINGSFDWFVDLWARRERLRDTPMLLAWGLQDFVLGPELDRWQQTFPQASTVEYPDVMHFVPEEVGAELVGPVKEFLARTET